MGAESVPRNWRSKEIRLQGPIGDKFSGERQQAGISLARQAAEANGSLWSVYKPETGKGGHELRFNRETHLEEILIEGEWIDLKRYMQWTGYVYQCGIKGQVEFDTYEKWLAKIQAQVGGNGHNGHGNGHGEVVIYQAIEKTAI